MESGDPLPKPRRRVMVVDDDPTIRNIIAQVLKLEGYDVQAASNGAEAFDLVLADSRPIDVLVTDLMMPLITGEELIQRTREVHPEIRVICLSASFTEAWLDLSVLFLPKPFTLRAIVSLVRSALEGTRRREAGTG
jgi:DNA-binding NtrC family response regulator